jgi:hypothetical protein
MHEGCENETSCIYADTIYLMYVHDNFRLALEFRLMMAFFYLNRNMLHIKIIPLCNIKI